MSSFLVNVLRRQIWRRLPRGVRETIAYRLYIWFGPRIPASAAMQEPVIVVGMLRAASGLGAAARACHDALLEGGVSVYGIDMTNVSRSDDTYADFAFKDGRQIVGGGTVLLHVSGLHVPLAVWSLGKRFLHKKRIAAHWFWELPKAPANWKLATRFVHEVWVNTNFVAEAVRPVAEGKPVRVVPYPLKPIARDNPYAPDAERPFTALVVFNVASNFARKNPCAAIAAFKQAFGDDPGVRLIVKYSNADTWPEAVRQMELIAGESGNIILMGDTLDDQAMSGLYDEAHVVISLHRSEGFGLVIAEAMQRGIPVIATNWSGNTDFFDAEVGIPIGFELIPVDDPQEYYRSEGMIWAEPKIAEAARALSILKLDGALRSNLGQAAAKRIASMYDPMQYVRAVETISSSYAVN